jgi:hypothetical protein
MMARISYTPGIYLEEKTMESAKKQPAWTTVITWFGDNDQIPTLRVAKGIAST